MLPAKPRPRCVCKPLSSCARGAVLAADDDNDSVLDGDDNCPLLPNASQADNDRDGRGAWLPPAGRSVWLHVMGVWRWMNQGWVGVGFGPCA